MIRVRLTYVGRVRKLRARKVCVYGGSVAVFFTPGTSGFLEQREFVVYETEFDCWEGHKW